MRRGFTLLEMLVVIGVILALAGISYPVLTSMRAKSDISATMQLVHGVAAAIEQYQIKTVTGYDDTHTTLGRIYRAWALGHPPLASDTYQGNDPSMMDGDPRLYPAGSTVAMRAPTSYTGFVNMVGFPVSSKSLNSYGQLVDRWHHPLEIAYASRTYGSSDFGVWSRGPDGGLPGGGTNADDISSWKSTDE